MKKFFLYEIIFLFRGKYFLKFFIFFMKFFFLFLFFSQSTLTPNLVNSSITRKVNILTSSNYSLSNKTPNPQYLRQSNRSVERVIPSDNEGGNALSTTLNFGIKNKNLGTGRTVNLGNQGTKMRRYVIKQQYMDFGENK